MRLFGTPAVAFALLTSAAWARLPASYSLNDHKMVIAIKNQGDLGTCWAFSSTTVLEYSLLKARLLSSERASNLVSEWDMAIHAGTQFSLVYPYQGWGSFPQNALGYLTRGFGQWNVKGISKPAGSGPVGRAGEPFNAYPFTAAANHENLGAFLPPPSQPTLRYRLVQAPEFSSKAKAGVAPSANYRDKIKQAILDYGALDTNINAYDLSNGINATYDTYAYTGPSPQPDHDVTVIGWNDNIPVYRKDGKQIGTGAWLIQNSWSSEFAPTTFGGKRPGCFWLGYVDTVAVKYCAAMVTEPRGSVSDTVLENEIFYPGGQVGGPKGTPSFAAARLTPQSDTDLLALGLWTLSDHVAVDVTIYPRWSDKGPAGTPLASLRNVLIPQAGYNEIPLAAPMPMIAGHAFYVVVSYGNRLGAPVPVDTESLKMRGPFDGLSWVSTDGTTWRDLALRKTTSGIYPLKGIQGGAIVRNKGAVLSVTGLRGPVVTTGSSVTLRGTASNNTRRIYYRIGDSGAISSAQGRTAWKITVNGLHSGRNVIQIWPAAAKGVVIAPLKVTVVRTDRSN